jgi:lantibiotic modifying enzyme
LDLQVSSKQCQDEVILKQFDLLRDYPTHAYIVYFIKILLIFLYDLPAMLIAQADLIYNQKLLLL